MALFAQWALSSVAVKPPTSDGEYKATLVIMLRYRSGQSLTLCQNLTSSPIIAISKNKMPKKITKIVHTGTSSKFNKGGLFFGIAIILFLILLFTSGNATPLNLPQSLSNSATLSLGGDWLFAQTAYPPPTPKTTQTLNWQSIRVPSLLSQQPNAGTIGIYRQTFNYPEDKSNIALYISNIRHADIVWLNNEKIGATGNFVPPWHFQVNNPQSLPRLYQIPSTLLKDKHNEIIIQVSLGFGDALAAMYPGGTGITQGKVLIGDYPLLLAMHKTKTLQTIAIDTVFVVLGIIDALLIIFLLKYALNRLTGYLWLVVNSLMMMIAAGAQDIFFIFKMDFMGSNRGFIIILLMLPLVNALFFWSSRKDVPIKWVYAFSVISLSITIVISSPHDWHALKQTAWFAFIANASIFYGYAIFAACDNFIKKRTGSTLQLLGLLFYIATIRSQWLPNGLFDHRNIQIGTIIFRYLIFFSYVRQFTEIKRGYNASIEKILSIDKATRSAIAMELHDGVIQRLASIRLLSQLLNKDHQTPSKHLHNLNIEVDSAIASIRSTMAHSHDRCFEHFSLQQLLTEDAKRLQNIYHCQLSWALDDRLQTVQYATEKWTHIYRIMHECMLNAIKHGNASNIHLTGRAKNNLLLFSVENNGTPFTLEQTYRPSTFGNGHGWTAIRERVSLLRGEINVYSNSQHNSVVELRCPIK